MKNSIKKLVNYSDANSFGSKLRKNRIAPLIALIDSTFEENGKVNIIDIGGTKEYWNIFPSNLLKEKNIHITVINLAYVSKPIDEEHFTFIEADACKLSLFRDNEFHIAHSNSVIEHVGNWTKITQFAGELNRVARKAFIQTPNYWFPVEPHCMTPFFHWLPKPLRFWLVLNFNLGNWEKAESLDSAIRQVENINLLNRKQFYSLFPKATIQTEKFLLLPKSFVAVKN